MTFRLINSSKRFRSDLNTHTDSHHRMTEQINSLFRLGTTELEYVYCIYKCKKVVYYTIV